MLHEGRLRSFDAYHETRLPYDAGAVFGDVNNPARHGIRREEVGREGYSVARPLNTCKVVADCIANQFGD